MCMRLEARWLEMTAFQVFAGGLYGVTSCTRQRSLSVQQHGRRSGAVVVHAHNRNLKQVKHDTPMPTGMNSAVCGKSAMEFSAAG